MCVSFGIYPPLFTESVPSSESQSVAGGDEDALDDYQELNAREEQDIEGMMEVCEYAISNAEAFAEKLSKELQVLDGVSCSRTHILYTRWYEQSLVLVKHPFRSMARVRV